MLDLSSYKYESLRGYIKQQNRFDTILDCVGIIDSRAKDLDLDYLFLFGSSARGTALYESDIDLLVLTKRKDHSHIACGLEDVIEDAIQYQHPEVQVTVVDTDAFIMQKDPLGFFQSIAHDIKLLGRYVDDDV